MQRFGPLAVLTLGLLIMLSACVGQTALVFENLSGCGTIHVELANSQSTAVESYDIPQGQTLTVIVTPDLIYAYYVNYSGADSICSGEYRGQVTVPSGSAQTFNLAAATPTPAR
jgi:hypothetical protein